MVRALVIGKTERRAIEALKEKAAANVIDAVEAMKQPPEVLRAQNASQTIDLPIGFHCTLTHEAQPQGKYKHLSVSVDAPGNGPNPHAVEMILEAFGMQPIAKSATCWTEYFTPRDFAVNVLQRMSDA